MTGVMKTDSSYARATATDKLGQKIDAGVSVEQAMEIAKLNGWNVHGEPLTTTALTENGVATLEIPKHQASVRTNPETGTPEVLGIVGKNYQFFQNEQVAEFAEQIADADGVTIDSCGSFKGGRQVFINFKLPEGLTVGGRDAVDMYLMTMTGHDGSKSLTAMAHSVRVFCTNQLRSVERTNAGIYTVKHTAQLSKWAAGEAARALQVAGGYRDRFQVLANQLIDMPMSDKEFETWIDKMWTPQPEKDASKAAVTNREKMRDDLQFLFKKSPTNENIRGTRWAAFNAFSEQREHYSNRSDQKKVAESVMFGTDAWHRGHAMKSLLGV